MNDYHDRVDEPPQGEDRPVAGWPGHHPDEHPGEHTDEHTDEQTDSIADDRTDEHTDEHTGETRDDEEPLVGEVWNEDTAQETDGEHGRPADVAEGEQAEDTHRDHVAEPFGTEEPMIVDDRAEESGGLATETAETTETTEPAEAVTDPDVEPVAVAEPIGTEPATEPGTETATGAEAVPETATGARPTAGDDLDVEHLVQPEAAERLRDRWRDVKALFVDDPADAVQQAGALSGEAVDELTAALGRLREKLEGHAGEGGQGDTERLRVALRGYGSLIDRILDR
jgi:hypothetical protein